MKSILHVTYSFCEKLQNLFLTFDIILEPIRFFVPRHNKADFCSSCTSGNKILNEKKISLPFFLCKNAQNMQKVLRRNILFGAIFVSENLRNFFTTVKLICVNTNKICFNLWDIFCTLKFRTKLTKLDYECSYFL